VFTLDITKIVRSSAIGLINCSFSQQNGKPHETVFYLSTMLSKYLLLRRVDIITTKYKLFEVYMYNENMLSYYFLYRPVRIYLPTSLVEKIFPTTFPPYGEIKVEKRQKCEFRPNCDVRQRKLHSSSQDRKCT